MNLAVESLKVLVEKNYGIAFDDQEMIIGDKPAPNPFWLSDFPAISSTKDNIIVVKVCIC